MHLPYPLGMLGGYCFDILSKVISKKYAVSYACTAPQFDETKLHDSGVVAQYILFYRDWSVYFNKNLYMIRNTILLLFPSNLRTDYRYCRYWLVSVINNTNSY